MKMRMTLATACLAIGAFIGTTAAQAASYSLTSDYSSTSNPNGAWSFNFAGGPLAHQATVQNNNALAPAVPAGGYYSPGDDLNLYSPDVIKAAVNGSAAGESNADFLAGDVIIHSPNAVTPLTLTWTAPAAGTITNLAAAVWYAHSAISRSNDVSLSLANVVLTSWTVSKTEHPDRDHPGTFSGAGPYSVNAGDLLTLSFLKSASESFGSLNGARLSFDFAAAATTPIPASLPLFASALAGLGWCARRRKQQAA